MESYPYNEQIEKTRKWYYGCLIAFAADLVLGPFVIWLILKLYGIEAGWDALIPDHLALEIARTQIKGYFCVLVLFVSVLVLSIFIGIYKAFELGRLEKRQKLLSNPEIPHGRTPNPDSVPQPETKTQLGPAPQTEIITQPDSTTQPGTTPQSDTATQLKASTQSDSTTQPGTTPQSDSSTQLKASTQPDSTTQPGTTPQSNAATQLETSTQSDSTTQPGTTPQSDSATQLETSTQPEIAEQPIDSMTTPSDLDTENDSNSIIINDNEEDTTQEAVPRNPNSPSERIVIGSKEEQVDIDPSSDVVSPRDVNKMLRILSDFKQKYIYGFAYFWLRQNGNLPGASQAAFHRFLTYNLVAISPGTICNEAGNAEIIAQGGNHEETAKKLSTKDNPNNSLAKMKDYELLSEKLQAFIPRSKTIDISVPKNQGTIIKDR